eukprot:2017962-Alexandrium_andersonii.AAC.1
MCIRDRSPRALEGARPPQPSAAPEPPALYSAVGPTLSVGQSEAKKFWESCGSSAPTSSRSS